jgi:hypothetical protein
MDGFEAYHRGQQATSTSTSTTTTTITTTVIASTVPNITAEAHTAQ